VTAFERHRIAIEGEDWSTTTDPLRELLDSMGLQPVMRSTANSWGYSAAWEVCDGGLYLTHLEGEQGVVTERSTDAAPPPGVERAPSVERRALVPTELFGHELPVLATWFTGGISVSRGLVRYVHAAWASEYAETRWVEVHEGRVTELGPIRPTPPPPGTPPAPVADQPRRPWWRRLVGR
jgi:hypothetical protein